MGTQNVAQNYFDQADAFIVAINSEEVVVDINKKACEIIGYSKNEVVGKNWFDNFVTDKKRENIRHFFHDMLNSTLRHVHYEHSVIAKSGEERFFNFHNIVISDERGNNIGTISSGAEITEQRYKEKTSKELENRLQVTLDYMIEGCQIIDYDWRYAYINEAAAKQGRKTKGELIGNTRMQVYPGIDKTELFNYLK